jgi:hypothetical protein
MKQKLSVSLESPQHGFMSIRLKAGDQSLVAVVSHTPYDSLRDLIEALSAVLDGDCDLTVKWNSEPEEYDFRLVSLGDAVRLDVIHYPDHRRSQDAGSTVFSFRGSKLETCRPFWNELRGLRARAARDEFDRQWRRDFPESELNGFAGRIKALESEAGTDFTERST